MARSEWRCRNRDCRRLLGLVHAGSKALRPEPGVIIIWHGVSATVVCPACGQTRVFGGAVLEVRKQTKIA